MTFGEKLKKLRESRKLTQTQMADMLGVSLRTYQYYESGRMYPKDKAVYQRTATRFNVTMDSLLGDQDLFIIDAQSKYGARGRDQATNIVKATEALYAGGTLSEEDEQAFYRQMTRIVACGEHNPCGVCVAKASLKRRLSRVSWTRSGLI